MDIILDILQGLILTLSSYLGFVVAKYLNNRFNTQQKRELVEVAVKLIEQTYKSYSNSDKYNKAVEWITEELNKKGLKYTDNELKGLIESTLKTFKSEFNKHW